MPPLEGKNVLVTGGGGFIGSTLVEQISEQNPASVRVFDNDEQRLFHLERRLEHRRGMLQLVLGDLRDPNRLQTAMEGVDVVFHAGAIKHVELSEYNPFEAVQTNVQGTQNVVRAALDAGVDSVTAVSTDKASNPASVMGATKLIMERLVVAANAYEENAGTSFNCVRFGNVLGSTGSVVPVFIEQIKYGGPITVTDPDMTRFIMSIDRAVNLILDAHDRMTSGEVVVLKMPAFRVSDLAEGLREEYAPSYGYDPEEIAIQRIGKRPGERIHEKLIAHDELDSAHELQDMFVILPEIDLGDDAPDAENSLDGEYTSADAEFLSPDEIATMVEQTRIPTRLIE
jgi:FlaA1/EpsC-like NDP-sugar epimerase